MIKINDIENYNEILNDEESKILYFSSAWCFPCMKTNLIMAYLNTNIKIYKIDIDKLNLKNKAVPSVEIHFDNNKIRIIGYEMIKENINRYI